MADEKMKKKKVIKNESELKEWFIKNYKKLGYSDIVRKGIGKCPDFIMLKNGKEINVELETVASNFLAHKHDLNKVDEVVCIINDIGLEKPVIVADGLEFRGNSNIKVTLSVDSKVYDNFQKFCEENAIMHSKKTEMVLEKILSSKNKNKKNEFSFFIFFMISLFLISSVNAVQVFSEGFESGSLSGWSLTKASGANDWIASATNPYQGSYHAQSQPQSTSEPASVMSRTISTSGYQNIILNYSRRLVELDSADEFQVEWYDGNTWAILEQTGSSAANDANYISKQFALSSGANNNANFQVKFECTAGAVSEFCRVDNVNLSGDIVDTSPPSINIVYPQNISYNLNVSQLNYSVSDNVALNKCWYSNNSGQWNSSIVNAGVNFTNVLSIEGNNNWRVYCNDSNGNLNQTSISFFKDTIIPVFSNYIENPGNGSDYLNERIYRFNATINEINLNIIGIEFKGVNYSGNYISNISNVYMFNISNLAAGTYSYYWWANDSSGNFNKSEIRYYSVLKATPTLIFLANNWSSNLSLIYPQQLNISAIASVGTVGLDKDGANYLLYNNVNTTLAVGSYIFRANITGNQNYSDISYSYYNITINKNSGNCQMQFNTTTPKTYPYKFRVYTNCNSLFTLYKNGIIISNNSEQDLSAGIYNFTVQRTDTDNFSNIAEEQDFIINQATPTVTFLLNGIANNLSIVYLQNLNASARTSGGNINLYRDENNIINENHQNIILGAAYYIYKANVTGNENYTDIGSIVLYANVTKANPNLSMSISITPSNNISYGTQTSASASETNTGDSDLVYEMFRNGTSTANPNTESLNAGTYVYEYNTTGGMNYTNGSVKKTLNVNKISNSVDLFLNGISSNLTIQYPMQLNASMRSDSGVLNLFRNNLDMTNENSNNVTLAGGYYEYLANSSGNVNYMQNSSGRKFYINITKAFSQVFVYLNYTHDNVTINNGGSVLINSVLDEGQGNIYVYINNSLIYYGIPPFVNNTIFSIPGLYNVSVIYIESQNFTKSFDTLFINVIDNSGPLISILYPEEKTYGYNTSLALNYSVSDVSGVSSCWYNVDNGINITLENCQNSSFNVSEGNHVINLYANDSLGILSSASRNFSISTTLVVNLEKPANNFWSNNKSIMLNYSVITLSSIINCSLWTNSTGIWHLNQTNTSAINPSGGINSFLLSLDDGNYIWNVECYAGSYNKFAFFNYSLNIDTINPFVSVDYPMNNSIFNQNVSILLNYSVSDLNLRNCLYSLDNGIINNSINNCINGVNNLNFGYKNGSYNLTVYANDSAGNIVSFSVYNMTIRYDSAYPNITITEPYGTKTIRTGIPINYLVNDNVDSVNELNCRYSVFYNTGGLVPGLENKSLALCSESNFDVPSDSDYYFTLFVRDRTGNLNSKNSNFTVSSSSPPPSSGGGGGSSGGGGSISPLNKNLSGKLELSKMENIIAHAGDKKILSLNAKNTGKIFLNNCRLVAGGEVGNWLNSKQSKGISPGENVNFIFDLNVPEDAENGDFSLGLEVNCDELKQSSYLGITIPAESQLIKIKEVKQNGNLVNILYDFDGTNLAEKEINVELWIVDEFGFEEKRIKDKFNTNNNIIGRNVSIDFSRRLVGIYSVYAASSSDLSNFVKQSVILGKSSGTGFTILDQPGNKMIAYVIFLLIISAGIFFIVWNSMKNKNLNIKGKGKTRVNNEDEE